MATRKLVTAQRSPGERMIRFLEKLRAPDGKHAGQPVRLADFQKEFCFTVYNQRREDGARIITDALLSMGRKNGKTTLCAGLVLGHTAGPEAVPYGQVYSAAFDRNQAAIIHRLAGNMVYMDAELGLQERLQVKESAKEIFDPISGSIYKALSAESRSKHGFSPVFTIFDELGQFGANRTLYDVLRTGGGARDDALFIVIGTQAADDLALLSELIDYGEQIKSGAVPPDPAFVSWLYAVPDDLDPFNEEHWHLANPGLGQFRSLDELRNMAYKAKVMPSAYNTFCNLYLNRRISAVASLINPAVWARNAGEGQEWPGMRWYGGLDLSGKLDLTAFVLAGVDFDGHVILKPYFFTPEATLLERAKRDRVPYDLWRKSGFLEATPGNAVDYDYVAERIGDIARENSIEEVGFDRWRIEDFKKACERVKVDLPLVEIGQGYKDMSPAVDDFEELATAGLLRHANNPILKWCVANLAVERDSANNRKPTKKRSTGRIDGAVAAIMAVRRLVEANRATSAYEEEGLLIL